MKELKIFPINICENTNGKNELSNCIIIDDVYNDWEYYKKVILHNKELLRVKGNDSYLIDAYFYIIGTPNKEETNFILGEYDKCKETSIHCYIQYIEVLKKQEPLDIKLIKDLYETKYDEIIEKKDCSYDSTVLMLDYDIFMKEQHLESDKKDSCMKDIVVNK